jgi:LysR family hydrogen peroxide-inducible transcriptional activator
MNLRDLQYLVAVADHRHFGRAAQACFVSQPTLSIQTKKLEAYLGVQPAERTNRQVLLTPIGVRIAERARGVLNDAADLVELAKASGDAMDGDLRLGLIPTIAPYLLPHLIPALRARYERLRPLLYEEQTAKLVERLRRGDLDAGIMAVPVGDDTLPYQVVYDEPFVVAMPPDHPLASKPSVTMADLARQHLMLLEEGHCLRDQALEVCQLAGAREDAGFRATSLETLRQMVAAGAGITLMPAMAVDGSAQAASATGLVYRRFSGDPPLRQVAIYYRRGSAREETVQTLAEMIRGLDAVRAMAAEAESQIA